MFLIRYLLICIAGFLVVRAFTNYNREGHLDDKQRDTKKTPPKKVSGKIGEYVDYEEIKKEKR